jgi:peptidyl-prolyl cis-trans isomerase C
MLDLKKMTTSKICGIAALACVSAFAQNAPAPTPAPAPDVPASEVVIKIDGKELTAGEIRAALANMPGDFNKFYQQNPKSAIEQLYVMRYLAQTAETAKLDQQSPVKEQLEVVRANALASAMLTYEHNHYPVSEAMVKDYYQRNQAKFQQFKIKGIFVAFKPVVPPASASAEDRARAISEAALGRSGRSEAEARTLAEDLVKQIRGGADFGKLVAQYSDDPASKTAGGDLGVVSATSKQPPELKRAVMALQPGAVADPVRQVAGFYVIRLEDKATQPMAELYEPIVQELRQAHVNEWFAAIRTRFTAEVEDPLFFARPSQGGAQSGAQGPPPAPAPSAPAK